MEDAFGFASLEKCKGAGVGEVCFDLFEVEVGVAAFNVLDSFIEDGEVSESEEVHFEESNFFDSWTIPLSDDVFFSGDGLEWQNGIEGNISDNDTGGVSTCASSESFDGHGEIKEFSCGGV